MQPMMTPQELLSAAGVQDYDLRIKSEAGQLPYKFSFKFAGDCYTFEMNVEEVQKTSIAPDPAGAARAAFANKITPIARGRVNTTGTAL
jgi:hypothetical protein